jgi:transcriptional regulator with XRE-family HTH domain
MHLATNIRYLRTERGLKQINLAKALGKTSAAVSDYEKGKVLPPLDVISQICAYFNVGLDDLVNQNLRKVDILSDAGILQDPGTDYQSRYETARERMELLERLNQLQEQRLIELEREIRENAPDLATRLGLNEATV